MNMKQEINDELLPSNIPRYLILEIWNLAQELDIDRLAIVGGAVRDSILNKINNNAIQTSKDIDLLVSSSAINLAKRVKNKLGEERVSEIHLFELFDTAEIKVDGYMIDIASAREESYPVPGTNPDITPSTIEKDLFRRDFTINAMAIEISNNNLFDLFEGQESLKNKELEFLHDQSVTDDPTRIIRAARYAAQLDLKLKTKSIKQIHETLKKWPWIWSHKDPYRLAPNSLSTRLKDEIELLLKQKEWEKAINYLQDWGALKLLDDNIQNDKTIKNRIIWGNKLRLKYLTLLIAGSEDAINIAKRLQIQKTQIKLLEKAIEFKEWIDFISKTNKNRIWSPSKWCIELENKNWNPEVIAIAISLKVENWEILYEWWKNWRHIKSPISAKEMIHQGWEPGPKLGAELKRLRYIYVNKTGSSKTKLMKN